VPERKPQIQDSPLIISKGYGVNPAYQDDI